MTYWLRPKGNTNYAWIQSSPEPGYLLNWFDKGARGWKTRGNLPHKVSAPDKLFKQYRRVSSLWVRLVTRVELPG